MEKGAVHLPGTLSGYSTPPPNFLAHDRPCTLPTDVLNKLQKKGGVLQFVTDGPKQLVCVGLVKSINCPGCEQHCTGLSLQQLCLRSFLRFFSVQMDFYLHTKQRSICSTERSICSTKVYNVVHNNKYNYYCKCSDCKSEIVIKITFAYV